MKTFLIFPKTQDGYGPKINQYQSEFKDDSSANRPHDQSSESSTHFELGEGQDADVVRPFLVAEVPGVEGSPEKWTKEGEEDVFEDPQDESWTHVPAIEAVAAIPEHWELQTDAALVAAKVAKQKSDAVAAAFNQMNTDVYGQMAIIFGTSNADSAVAYEKTWALMVETPSDWHQAGLKAKFAVGGLAVGDALDTVEKVQAYASAKVAEIKAYGVQRMQRIEQFYTERDQILAQ